MKYRTFIQYFPCNAAFGNLNCYSTAKAKDLINFPSFMQVFALTSDIPVLTFKWEKSLLLMDFLFRS